MSREKNTLTFQTNINLHMLKGFLTNAKAKFKLFSPEISTIAFGEVNTILFITVSVFHTNLTKPS